MEDPLKIISFNEAKRDDLIQKANAAQKKKQFREAYDFLREALRYGENAAVFNRAATILNEMGEYQGSLQVGEYALKCEPHNPWAKWEMAIAMERLWRLDESLEHLKGLPEGGLSDSPNLTLQRKNNVEGMCHLKRQNLTELRKMVFRGAEKGQLPEPLASRAKRLENYLKPYSYLSSHEEVTEETPLTSFPKLGLRDWMEVMYRYRLLRVCSPQNTLALHLLPSRQSPEQFRGEHFVMGHPNFLDCAKILKILKKTVEEEAVGYRGVYPVEPNSHGLSLALSKILEIPVVDSAKIASSDPILLCLASNLGGAGSKVSKRWPLRHELFILAKSFERDEFCDVVSPPNNASMLNTWAEPIFSGHRQIVGAIGEYMSVPWEEASIKAYQTVRSEQNRTKVSGPSDGTYWDPSSSTNERSSVKIAERLLSAYREVKETS
jgi:hypothetical protein